MGSVIGHLFSTDGTCVKTCNGVRRNYYLRLKLLTEQDHTDLGRKKKLPYYAAFDIEHDLFIMSIPLQMLFDGETVNCLFQHVK